MNMITTIKNDLKGLLAKCGVAEDHVHYHASKEKEALHNRSYPVVALITGDEKFNNNFSYYVRGTRTIPIEMRIWAADEEKAMDIAEKVMGKLPKSWKYNGKDGEIEVKGVSHSDHIANVSEYYACFIVCNFSMQVHASKK